MRSATHNYLTTFTYLENFNPRTPCGVRRGCCLGVTDSFLFQSTHSMRSATQETGESLNSYVFQSTHSMRSATISSVLHISKLSLFQSTHSMRSATAGSRFSTSASEHFNPRTPCGVRLCLWQHAQHYDNFNPRTPCGVRRLMD